MFMLFARYLLPVYSEHGLRLVFEFCCSVTYILNQKNLKNSINYLES